MPQHSTQQPAKQGTRHETWRVVSENVQCHEDRLALPLRWRAPRTVFVNSMSDLFHDAVPDAFIDRVFAVMALCPQHTFICLTKRPERMQKYVVSRSWSRGGSYDPTWASDAVTNAMPPASAKRPIPLMVQWPLPNVWLGVSVEDQRTADERIPRLLQTPAAVRFVSAEPLLGPVDLACITERLCDETSLLKPLHGTTREWNALRGEMFHGRLGYEVDGLSWVIIGGESGPQARPCDVAWIRSLKGQAQAAGVPCFVKQLGANPVDPTEDGRYDTWGPVHDRKGGDPSEWPDDLRVREWPKETR